MLESECIQKKILYGVAKPLLAYTCLDM